MSHERVFASARVHVPDPDAGVQTPGHNVHSIKLKWKYSLLVFVSWKSDCCYQVNSTTTPGWLQLIRIFICYTASHLQTVDTVCVTRECVQTLLPLRVPDLDHVVVGAADHESPVILDTPHGRHVTHQHVETLARLHVPHPQRGVPGATDHPAGVQVHAAHRARVPVQGVHTGPALSIPNLKCKNID